MSLTSINKYKRKVILLIALMLLLGAGSAWAFDPTHPDYPLYKELENSLMCTDGCGMALVGCDNNTAVQMREELRQFITEGQTKDEILQSFVAIYGVEVLTYPPKQGFNISAWVTPFIAIMGGGVGIYLALNKWVFNNEEQDLIEEEEEQDVDMENYEDILEEERKKYL